MNKTYLTVGLAAAALLFTGLRAAGPDEMPPPPPPPQDELDGPPPPPHNKSDRRGGGPSMWRAFARLTEEQRQELLKLQLSDPETFRTRMRELGDALRKEEQAGFAELMKQVERFRASTDEAEKAALKAKITDSIRKHYLERLEDNKRQIEEMKRRTERLEEELRKREANAEEIIKARAEALIRGERPEPDLPPRKPGK